MGAPTLERGMRATRGKRMRDMVGEELDADTDFWNQDFFQEEQRDIEYETESESHDTLDSDFSEPESSDDEDADDPDDDGEPKKKKLKPPGYKRPPARAKRSKAAAAGPSGSGPPGSVRRSPRAGGASTSASSGPVVVRKSSRSSVMEATAKFEEQQKIFEKRRRKREGMPKRPARRLEHLSMRDILEEAAITELENAASLARLLEKEEEARRRNAVNSRTAFAGPRIRFRSFRGSDGLAHNHTCYLGGAEIPAPPSRDRQSLTQRPASARQHENRTHQSSSPLTRVAAGMPKLKIKFRV